MKTITIIAVLICCLLIFIVKRKYKIGIMLLGTMCFTVVRLSLPFQMANSIIAACFIISEIPHLKTLINEAKGTIVWKLAGLATVMTIVTILFSPHLRTFNEIRYFLQGYLFFYYFGLIYSFWCFKDDVSLKPTLRITFIGLIVLTIFGLINYITKSADFVTVMEAGWKDNSSLTVDIGEKFAESDRFRVMAMFENPFDYGYICIMMLLLHIYGLIRHLESKSVFLIVLACSIFGIITCGSRTVIFCTLIGISVFTLLTFRARKSIRAILLLLFIIPIAYQTVPPFQELMDNTFTMFDKNSRFEGSSVEMRTLQYATVFYYIQDSPLFGCGYNYFNEDLGWGEGRKYLKDSRLEGLEGVVMSYLLERGFVGLLLYLIFWISLIVFLFKNRNISKPATALGIAVLASYLSFANMTGELLSVYPTLLIMGFCVKVVINKKKEIATTPSS